MKKGQISLIVCVYVILLIIGMKYNTVQAGVYGVSCSDFGIFKQYMELDDGNEYHMHLDTNISITDTVYCKGTKRIYGHSHFLVNDIGKKNDVNEMINVAPTSTLTIEDHTFFDGKNTSTIASANLCIEGVANVYDSDFHNSSQGIHVGKAGVLNFYSGTISSSNSTMGIGAYGTVNFYGGTITGNRSNPAQGIHINGGKINMNGGTIDKCIRGIYIFNNATVTINNGTISSNKIGIDNTNGTVIINGGKINNSETYGIYNSSNLNVKGGEIYSNNTGGIYNASNTEITAGTIYSNNIGIDNRSILSISGGIIRDNKATDGAGIYHNGSSCTITGGTFEEDQNVYLAADDKFVITNSSTPTFEVKPNNYIRGRKVVQTNSASDAINELNYLSLFPNSEWMLRAVNADIKIWNKSTVTTNYVDESGKELATSVTEEDWVDEEYTTTAKTIYGYKLKSTPTNSTGTYTDEDINVNYIYEKNESEIEIRYVDKYTNTVLNTKLVKGIVGDNYTITPESISEYEVENSNDITVEFEEEKKIVTCYYIKLSKLTISYIDLTNSNAKLISDVVVDLKQKDTYTTESKSFEGYTLTQQPTNKTVTMERENITVTYGYKKNSEGVEVKYIDKFTGEEVYDTVTKTGLVGDTFTVEEKEKAGYEIVTRPANKTVTMTEDKITITYEYAKLSTITVSYIDLTNSNEKLKEDVVVSKKQGDTYTTSAETFEGYTLVNQPINKTVTVGRENISVTYGYKKNSQGIEVKYVDKYTGENIYDVVTKSGLIGDTYTVEEKEKAGYEIVTRPANKTVTMTEDKITITYEYAKLSTITVSYIDLTNSNEKLKEDVVVSKKQGDTYTTSAEIFNGYRLTQQPTNKTVTVGRENISIIYGYKKESEGVEVKYVDKFTGEEVYDTVTKTGLVGDKFTVEEKEKAGYEIVTRPANKTVTMTEDKITITYEYAKLSTITVSYIDLTNSNAKLKEDIVVSKKQGDTYTTNAEIFEGYTLVNQPTNKTVTVGRENISVTYEYKKNSRGVEVKYVDKFTGENIYDVVTKTGFVGDTYTVEEKEKAGYEIVARPDSATVTFTEEKIIITYEYAKLSKVKVIYKDITNNIDIESNENEYKQGDTYTTTAKEFEGYVLTNTPANKEGTIERTDIVVTYEYRRTGKGVTIRYVDKTTGEDLVTPPIIKMGNVGDEYTSEAKIIAGYELVKTPTNANGNITEEAQEVIYEYVKLSTLTVRYIDLTNSNAELTTDVVETLKEGETYTTEAKTFTGYTLTQQPTNQTVTMGRENITVTYEYKKNSKGIEVKYVDKFTGENIYDVVTKTGFVGDTYTVEEKEKAGYEIVTRPSNTTVTMTEEKVIVTYEYAKLSNVKVIYKDITNNVDMESNENEYKQGDTYITTAKEFEGYVLLNNPENKEGTVGRTNITVTYEYKKTGKGVTIKYIDKTTKANLETPIVKTGNVGDEYTSEAKTIAGYELVKTPTNANGNITEEAQEVIYEYVKLSTLTVRYIDLTNSNAELTTDVVETLKEGETYTTEAKTFTGYTLTQQPTNQTVTMGRENITVTYGYKKNSKGIEVKYVDKFTGENIYDVVTKTGFVGDTYTVEEKEKAGYEIVTRPNNTTVTMTEEKVIITYEYVKLSKVTVSYIDVMNPNIKLAENIVVNVKQGDTYITEAKTFENYLLTQEPENTTIIMGREDIIITYGYKKISGGVEVRYIDQVTGNIITDTEYKEGKENDNYTTEPKEIAGYELVKTPENATGEMTVEKITVTYEYRKLSNVVTKYVDLNDNNKEITDAVTQTLKEGEAYTTTAIEIEGYELVITPENSNGTLGNSNIEIVYGYKKTTAGVDIEYIDQVTKDTIATTEHKDGLEKAVYTTEAKEIAGYELVKTPENATGEMTVEKITVTYEYRKLSNVVTKYVDLNDNNKEITDEVTQTLKEGEAYTTTAKEIEGYELVSTPENNNGTLGNSNIEIVYGYKKTTAGVDIEYIDQVTKDTIATTEHKDGLERAVYTTEAKEIVGYELVLTPENATGEMTVEKITVTYEYRKLSNVVTKYVDLNDNNKEITDEVTQTLKEGDTYTTTAKEIEGYELVSTPENNNGTLGNKDIEVIYGYKKTTSGVEVKYIDQVTGKDIYSTIKLTGLERAVYTTEAKEIVGYELVLTPENATGEMTVEKITVTYEYRKLSNVVTKYVDLNDNNKEITDEVTQTLKEGDTYTTTAKEIEGYKLVTIPENNNGILGNSNITVIYGYKKISQGIDVRYIDQVTKDEIVTTEHKDGLEKDRYTTEPKIIEGYELVLMPENTSGEMTVEKITVTYEYRKLSNVVVKYIDENTGIEIEDFTIETYKEGDEYKTLPKNKEGYVVTTNPENKEGTVGREDIEVVYGYKKVSEGLVVKYVDMIKDEILDTKEYTGNEGDVITLEEKEIEEYVLVESPEETEITLTPEYKEVTYYYKKKVKTEVIGIDVNTNKEIYKDEIDGIEGEEYSATPKEIEGYVLVERPENETIITDRDADSIVYKYKKISKGVTIKYIDDYSEKILDEEKYEGLEGDSYSSEIKEYEKYDFVKVEGNPEGKMIVDETEVVYHYEKKTGIVEVIYVDENGNELLVETLEDKVDNEYKVEEKEIKYYRVKEYPENTDGVYELEKQVVTYVMEKIPGKVIVYLKDKEGNIIGQLEENGYVGENVEIELPENEGYKIVGDTKVKAAYIDGELVIEVLYEKIIDLPETGDINVVLYLITFLSSMILITKKLIKE